MSELTASQLAELAEITGMSDTEIISVAIDRMYGEETMDKQQYTISFDSGVVWHERHATIAGAKKSATDGLAFGCGDVVVEGANGERWMRRFWRSGDHFGWEGWEQIG